MVRLVPSSEVRPTELGTISLVNSGSMFWRSAGPLWGNEETRTWVSATEQETAALTSVAAIMMILHLGRAKTCRRSFCSGGNARNEKKRKRSCRNIQKLMQSQTAHSVEEEVHTRASEISRRGASPTTLGLYGGGSRLW